MPRDCHVGEPAAGVRRGVHRRGREGDRPAVCVGWRHLHRSLRDRLGRTRSRLRLLRAGHVRRLPSLGREGPAGALHRRQDFPGAGDRAERRLRHAVGVHRSDGHRPPHHRTLSSVLVGGLAHLWCVNILATIHMPTVAIATGGVYPNLNGVGGVGQLETVIGALMTIVLIVAVLMMLVCAATWALASAHGNYQTATKARAGLLVAVGAAALDGGGIAWLNFLLHVGPTL